MWNEVKSRGRSRRGGRTLELGYKHIDGGQGTENIGDGSGKWDWGEEMDKWSCGIGESGGGGGGLRERGRRVKGREKVGES